MTPLALKWERPKKPEGLLGECQAHAADPAGCEVLALDGTQQQQACD